MDTPKARELKLPWEFVAPNTGDYSCWISDNDADIVASRLGLWDRRPEYAAIVKCTNLLGPRLDNHRFIAAVESLSRLAAEDPERLGQVLDWIEEHIP